MILISEDTDIIVLVNVLSFCAYYINIYVFVITLLIWNSRQYVNVYVLINMYILCT